MAQLIWTISALHDLNEIAEYISLQNYDAAKKLVNNVFTAVEVLEDFPSSGRYPPELNGAHYREVICKPCRIFYKLGINQIIILYVMRSERKLRRYLLEERKRKANHQIQ
jgi:toxin ParE1/3/4